jgi:ABC-type Mn2+/Zn2+ transport system ATPase subunit
MAIVEMKQVEFAYAEQPVLRKIDLRIEPGITLGLIGPNAGGKTTLMRLMLGLLKPDSGEIRVDGISPRRAAARGDVIGYLPQKAQFPDNLPLSVRQAVRLGLAGKTGMLRAPAKADLEFVDSLMARMGLADFADQPVSQLSGGQVLR